MTQHEHLLHRLKHQHLSIEWLISSVNPGKIKVNAAPGKWSLHDLVTHLARYQPIFIERISVILNEHEPMFNRYRAEEDAEFEEWRSWSTELLLSRLVQDRNKIFEVIQRISPDQAARKGKHIKFGLMNVYEWVDFFLWHEAHHIFVMYQLAHDVDLKV